MRNFLIKFLGGFTTEEFDLLRMETSTHIEVRDDEVYFLRNELKIKDSEIQRLTNLMLTRAQFIVPTSEGISAKHESINTRRSWPQIKREKELEDAKCYADEVEQRWKAKSGAMPVGDPENGGDGKERT